MRSGTNAIEACKASKGGDGLRIRDDLLCLIEKGHGALTPAEKDLLKWVGVFFRKPTPGRFMMRIRMPNGFTSARQLRAIADLSGRLGNCVLDITTRQQIQLRGFTLPRIPEIWEKLRGVDLHSLQTGMDNVRNINGCPLAGLALNELFDASPVVFELDRVLVGDNGNPEFTNLPRKFNLTITGCLENCTHNESQDLALVPALRRDRAGFNVLVGGKMGSGGFTVASPLDVFVKEQEAATVVAELIRIYRDHGPRDARAKCRLAFLIQEWGLPRLREELVQRLGYELPSAGRDVRAGHSNDHLGIAPQNRPGYRSVGMCVPVGRLHADELNELARLADVYGDSEVRLTTGQNAIIPNVPAAKVDALLDEDLLRSFSPFPSSMRRGLVVCTGTDFCNLAQIDTKAHAAELATKLEQRLGTRGHCLKIHWSGCPAGCGNHEAADIGFRGLKTKIDGKLVDAVSIYVGGRTGPNATPGRQIVEVTSCDSLPDVVAGVIRKLDPLAEPEQIPALDAFPELSTNVIGADAGFASTPGTDSAD